MNFLGLFNVINEKIFNEYLTFNKKNNQSSEIAVIQIDNNSVKKVGKWPWKRSIFSNLLNNIIPAKPAVIGFYFSFTEPGEDKAKDSKLYQTLKSFPNIVLARKMTTYKDDKISLKVPVKSIFPDILHGHNAFKYSDSGIVKSVPLKLRAPAFSLQVLKLYQQNKTTNKKLQKLLNKTRNIKDFNNQSILIDYKRLPENFKHYSAIDVLNKEVPPGSFKNKIVLVGITDKNLTSVFSTPFTGEKVLSSSEVQLQAQIIDSLINYRGLQQVSNLVVYSLSLLLLAGFVFLTMKKRIITQGIIFLAFIFCLSGIDFILFKNFALWFPPALAIILILVSYGISLYFTSSNVDNELIKSFNKLQESKKLPVLEVPTDINSRVKNLIKLLEIINSDRETIKGIIDGVNNGIVVFDKNGKITWANIKIMILFADSLFLNQPIGKLFEDINLDEVKNECINNCIYKKELIIKEQEFLCVINRVEAEEEQYVAIFNDITEFKKLDRLKTDMVRMVSHELKTPLTGINICAENIVYIEDRQEAIKNAENIINASENLLDIITNFLSLSRLENDLITLNLETVSVSDMIQESIQLHESVHTKKNIDVMLNNNDIPEISADKKQLQIVFNNLISNAIKYSQENSTVTIDLIQEDPFISISVKDSGTGIPEDEQDKIFEKFYRARKHKQSNVQGTGIGLAITKRIVEMHKGQISVKSKPKEGSTFTVLLPIEQVY